MHDDLGDRMKKYYEVRSQTHLIRRMPVIIRIDGKSFHTFCKNFEKPYSIILNHMLNETALFLCNNIQGCKFAERHSDEISLFLTDYDKLTTDAFFDYNVQKICSVVASMATAEFCRQLFYNQMLLMRGLKQWPNFDARCYNLPKEEVANYFYWRINDAVRNSIGMFVQSMYSAKELHGKSINEQQEMMFAKGFNWNDLEGGIKSGFIIFKQGDETNEKFALSPSPKNRTDLGTILEPLININKD